MITEDTAATRATSTLPPPTFIMPLGASLPPQPSALPSQVSALSSLNMNDIICPHCHKAFKVDEAGYADILKQVHDGEFEQQLHERLELAEKEKLNAVELAQEKAANESQKTAAAKQAEIQELKAQLDKGEEARKLAVAAGPELRSKRSATSWPPICNKPSTPPKPLPNSLR